MASKDELIQEFNDQLRYEWERLRLKHNPTLKGQSYEAALQEFLETYLSSRYTFYANVALIDDDLACFDRFDADENEFDVVGMYQGAVPELLFRTRDLIYAPLNGVAMVVEVKSLLTKENLTSDLQKLSKIREIARDPDDRFPDQIEGQFTANWQLHCLFYDREEIADETLRDRLMEYDDAWDILCIVDNDAIIINAKHPVAYRWGLPPDNFPDEIEAPPRECICHKAALPIFVTSIAWGLPIPYSVTSSIPLTRLMGGGGGSPNTTPTTDPDQFWNNL